LLPPFCRLCRSCAFLFFGFPSSCANFSSHAFHINTDGHTLRCSHTSGNFAHASIYDAGRNSGFVASGIEYWICFGRDRNGRDNRCVRRWRRNRRRGTNGSANSGAAGFAGARHAGDFG
jgi:hypothetical protein